MSRVFSKLLESPSLDFGKAIEKSVSGNQKIQDFCKLNKSVLHTAKTGQIVKNNGVMLQIFQYTPYL